MLAKWCEVTSCNGVIDLYESKAKKNHFIFWTVVMVSMVMLSIVFTYRTIQGYIDSPTVTNVGTISKTPMDMPDALLCYNGGLNAKKMLEAKLSENFVYQFAVSMLSGESRNTPEAHAAKKEFDNFLAAHKITVKDFVSMFSFDFNEIFDNSEDFCSKTNNRLNCSNPQSFLSAYGKCFSFINNSQQYFPNVFTGMVFKLKEPHGSVAEVLGNKIPLLTSEFLLTFEKDLRTEMSGRSFIVPMNSKTKIVLSPKRYKRIAFSSPCESSEDIYSSNTCFYRCCDTTVRKKYNCTPITFWVNRNAMNICSPFALSRNDWPLEEMGSCLANCLSKCNEWLFEGTISSSFFSTNGSDRQTLALVGFETMQYVQYEEVMAFTIDMAISNVGGQSGLWLGLSAATVIQAFYYIFLSIFRKNTNLKNLAPRTVNVK